MLNSSRQAGRSMISIMIALVIIVAIVAAVVNYRAKPTPQVLAQQISLGASANSELIVVGTLAPLGSFEYRTAPLLTLLAVKRSHGATALLQHQINVDQAVALQGQADAAREDIDEAMQACDPAPHTGKCRGSPVKTDELLAEARSAVAAVPDYTPGVN
jgi:hypothetical protein